MSDATAELSTSTDATASDATVNSTEAETGGKKKKGPRKNSVKISDLGFDSTNMAWEKFQAKYQKVLTPKTACRVRDYLTKRETPTDRIPQQLLALADTKRPGRQINGPMEPPKDGEVRKYTVSAQGRIGLSVDIIGRKAGEQVYVSFSKDGIAVMPNQP